MEYILHLRRFNNANLYIFLNFLKPFLVCHLGGDLLSARLTDLRTPMKGIEEQLLLEAELPNITHSIVAGRSPGANSSASLLPPFFLSFTRPFRIFSFTEGVTRSLRCVHNCFLMDFFLYLYFSSFR